MQSFNYLSFTVASNATYSVDGFFEMTGDIGAGTLFRVYLQDTTTGTFIFNDTTSSSSTTHAYFEAGVANDGDAYNETYGDFTGNLTAGHNYTFYYGANIQSNDYSQITMVAATANGAVNFVVSTVPIPTAAWLFGSGLLGLAGIARRKKAASH